ncbi:MAG: MOP flippase family protein [bacterium]
MSESIRDHVFSGVKWNLVGKLGHYGMQFIVSIILARLLLPAEFGLIGMLAIFMAIAQVFINSGMSSALIQKKDTTGEDYSTVFYYNLMIAFIFYALLFFTSGYIAAFFDQPELTQLTKYMAMVFLINAAGTVQATILKKELRFKKINVIKIIGVIISGVVAVFMAYNDFGVYAIVGQAVSFALVTNALYWLNSNWKPAFVFSKQSFINLFGFGAKLLISSLLDQVYKNLSTLIIGKAFSAAQLGYFTRAKSSRDLPIQNTSGVLTNIVFPVFAKEKNDETLKRHHLKFLSLVAYVTFPVMVGMAIVAEPFIVILFTDKWLPSVPMLQILCIGGPTYPLSVILVSTLLAKGKSGLFLKLDIYKKSVGLAAMVLGLLFGFYPFLLGVTAASLIGLILNFYYVGKTIHTKAGEYANALMPGLMLSLAMGAIVFGTGYLLPENHYIQLTVQATLGIFIYAGASYMLKLDDFEYLKNLLREKLQRKKT